MTEDERRNMLLGDNARRETKNEQQSDYPVEVTEVELSDISKEEEKQTEQPATPVLNNSPALKKSGRLARFLKDIKK